MAAVHGMGDLPEKSVILIEEETGAVKSMYALYLASELASAGQKVCYVTSKAPEEVARELEILHLVPAPGSIRTEEFPERGPAGFTDFIASLSGYDLIIADQFSQHFLEVSLEDLRAAVARLSDAARSGVKFLLLIDRGVLPARHERLIESISDGVIQITTVPEGDKLKRYLHIPKMKGLGLLDKMLPFTVSDEGFLIDTRERHG